MTLPFIRQIPQGFYQKAKARICDLSQRRSDRQHGRTGWNRLGRFSWYIMYRSETSLVVHTAIYLQSSAPDSDPGVLHKTKSFDERPAGTVLVRPAGTVLVRPAGTVLVVQKYRSDTSQVSRVDTSLVTHLVVQPISSMRWQATKRPFSISRSSGMLSLQDSLA